jgi:hypothetical protein
LYYITNENRFNRKQKKILKFYFTEWCYTVLPKKHAAKKGCPNQSEQLLAVREHLRRNSPCPRAEPDEMEPQTYAAIERVGL